jgi:metallo-beta-lactamase family protein
MKLQFLGAAKTVTGSRTLLTHRGKRILIDCGLFQGPKEKRLLNWEGFIDPKSVDAVILTHAHLDHSGYIPKFVKDGYSGPIFCSSATRDLCRILLQDAAHLQEEDADYANETKYSSHFPALPLYTAEDTLRALRLFRPIDREDWFPLFDHMQCRFLRSGHILGSRFVQIACDEVNGSETITFSGDLGNGRSRVIKPPLGNLETDTLILEATYGDRVQPREDPTIQLAPMISKVMARNGVLLIPAFSVGRTQEILLLIREMENQKTIPKCKVYLDSPMANHATDIYINHPEEHLLTIKGNEVSPPICTSDYTPVKSKQDSMSLCFKRGPMIVVSAAGMLTGGRVMHHLKSRITEKENAILFVGFQAEQTKGRLLQGGIKELRIHHQNYPVRAEIMTIDSLSAHADSLDTIEWLNSFRKLPRKIFINHGELNACTSLAAQLRLKFGVEVIVPSFSEEFKL